jgi:hypothetical protein
MCASCWACIWEAAFSTSTAPVAYNTEVGSQLYQFKTNPTRQLNAFTHYTHFVGEPSVQDKSNKAIQYNHTSHSFIGRTIAQDKFSTHHIFPGGRTISLRQITHHTLQSHIALLRWADHKPHRCHGHHTCTPRWACTGAVYVPSPAFQRRAGSISQVWRLACQLFEHVYESKAKEIWWN